MFREDSNSSLGTSVDLGEASKKSRRGLSVQALFQVMLRDSTRIRMQAPRTVTA
jgi:hypothetical protein